MANSSTLYDHGALDGLSDNDHPQYLLVAGDTITGDIAVDAGVTIDGLDLSIDVPLWGLL